MLTSDTDPQYDTGSVHKFPQVFQNTIPEDKDSRPRPRMWNPIWLHSLVLSAYVLLFLALLAGLIILWHFAKQKNGISTTITTNHYAWTYGPTALLVIIGAGWRQVDFHCRNLAPWSRLRDGSVSAQSSLLMDYVSPILPKALATAAANHEWAVLASGMGILLLRIVIVFSTGLLVLTPTIVSKATDDAVINSMFAGTNYQVATTIDDHELIRYYGVQEQGMDYQYGVNGNVAYETVDLHSVVPNSTVTTTVNGVFPFFHCEVVAPQLKNFTWDDDDKLILNATMVSTKCPQQVLVTYPSLCQPTEGECYIGKNIVSDDEWYSPNLPFGINDETNPCAHLYQVSIAELHVEKVSGQLSNTSASWNVTLPSFTGLICMLGYTVDTVTLTINAADPTSPGGVNTTGPLSRVLDVLPGYSYTNFTSQLVNEVEVNSLPKSTNSSYIYNFPHLFAILNGDSGEALLDTDTLKATAEKAFKGVGAQIAHKFLRKAHSKKTAASLLYEEQRLQIRIVSVWVMSVVFVLLSLSAFAVLVWRPRDVVARNPGSIANQAAMLAASPSIQRVLDSTGSFSVPQLKRHLSAITAGSHLTHNGRPSFFIETTSHDSVHDPSMTSNRIGTWWSPMSTKVWFMGAAIALPFAAIVALEVLQRESRAHNGLANVSATSVVDHSLPSILASLAMISIAIMYEAVNFTAATLAPYQALMRGSSPPKRNLLGASFGDLPIWSTLEALRRRHSSAAAASFATIIGSLLTVFASGLYTTENVLFASNANVTTTDKFVPSFSTESDGGAGGIFNLIEHSNASYPALTYDELVFPNIDLSSLGSEALKQLSESEQITLQVSIPAVRASLNCTLVPRDAFVLTNPLPPVAEPDTKCPNSLVSFNVSLPASCLRFLDKDNNTATEIPFENVLQHVCPGGSSDNIYQQTFLNGVGGAINGTFDDPQTGSTLGAGSNPPGCPSLAFLSGFYVVNSTSTENFTAMTCIQGLEQVQTSTTFTIFNTSIQISSAPTVDESTALWLTAFNSTYWITYFSTFDEFYPDNYNILGENFYQQVTFGPGGIPANELTGPSNTDRFVAATQHTYRRYMAQLINSNMRQPLSAAEASDSNSHSHPATISNITVLRLKQNTTSALILQVLLGVMLACGLFVYGWRNIRHVLPHCPWSIAGTMSLLAGSSMLENIPPGAEFMSEKELEGVFEGYLFSLGWWAGGKRRFGVDIGEADGGGTVEEGEGMVR